MEGRGRGASQSARLLPSGNEEAGVAPPSVDRCPARPSPAPSAERGQSSPRGWAMPLGLLFQLQVKPVWGSRRGSGGASKAGGSRIPALRKLHEAGRLFRGSLRQSTAQDKRSHAAKAGWVGNFSWRAGRSPALPRHFFQAPPLLFACPGRAAAARDLCCDLSREPASIPGWTRGSASLPRSGKKPPPPTSPPLKTSLRSHPRVPGGLSPRCRTAMGDLHPADLPRRVFARSEVGTAVA